MARSTARAAVMQMIFENLAGGEGGEETLAMVYEALRHEGIPGVEIAENEPNKSDKAYIARVLDGVLNHLDELDAEIQAASPRWNVSRMPKVDLTILRLAAWEILHEEDVPGSVAINEAVNLATRYSEPTSVAAVTVEGQVIASCRKLLPVKLGERGLRQSEGVWHHVRALPERLEELAPHIRGCEIAAVCVSARPRDEADSYMPVFHAGDAQGRGLAAMLGVPCFSTTHQRGHIAAAKVDSGIVDGDLLAVHLSGGTTELLSLVGEELTLLGGTLDLHAGQVVDRTGVAMGLPFPAGPHLEKLAVQGHSEARLTMTTRDGGLNCHLSGAETQVQRWIKSGELCREDIAREVYDLLARTVARMICAGAEKTGIGQVLIAGGVSSSALFRELVTERIHKRDRDLRVCFGKPEFSGDNAVGTALIGAQMLRENEE